MEKLRLGGMALANGVLVHGPTAWGCAVRAPDGSIRVASGAKPRFAPGVQTPFLRGPLRLAEAFALLPELRRRLPEARLAFERPASAGGGRGRLDDRSCGAPLDPLDRRARGSRRARLARACGARAAWRRAGGLPRRRARLDRELRAGRPGGEGARPLRLTPRRPAARAERRRRHPRGEGSCRPRDRPPAWPARSAPSARRSRSSAG